MKAPCFRFCGTFTGLRREIAARYARQEQRTEPVLLALLLLLLAIAGVTL